MAYKMQHAEPVPGDAPAVEVSEEDERDVQLQASRRFMQVALAGCVIFFVLMLTTEPQSAWGSLGMAGYVASWLGTVLGVSRGAAAIGMNPGLRIAFYVLAFMPLANLVPIAYFLGRSKASAGPAPEERRRQETVEAARQRALERQRARADASGATSAAAGAAPQPAAGATVSARERLSKALPRIRLLDTEGLPDGALIRSESVLGGLALPAGFDLSQVALPVTRSTRGLFGVQYMIDEGDRYTAVAEPELAKAGLTPDELHRMALNNLRALVKDRLKLQRAQPDDPAQQAFRLRLDGDNEASLLLLDELWDKVLKKHIPNGVMAVIPTRDVCVFIDFAAVPQGGMGDLRDAMVRAKQERGDVFNAILHRQDGAWALAGQVDGL